MQPRVELTLHPRRLKTLRRLAFCAAFVCIGIILVCSGDSAVVGWPAVVFFGLGAALFTLQLVPGVNFLRLSEGGFAVRNLFRTTNFRWSDVNGFAVQEIHGTAVVVCSFTDECQVSPHKIAGIPGVDWIIPDTFGNSAEDLAQILNDWKHGLRRVDA